MRTTVPTARGEQLRHLVHDPVQPLLPALVCESVHVENVARGERELYLLVVSLICAMLGEWENRHSCENNN